MGGSLFDPTPLSKAQKSGSQVGGGGGLGGRDQNSLGDAFIGQIMILQGVKLTIQPLGVGYANRPKEAQTGAVCGVFPYIRACVALIQQPLRGDSMPLASPPRREANSQPISQSVTQAVTWGVGQASRQARKQASKNTQFGFFFSHGLHLQTVGNPSYTGASGDRVVEHSLFASNVVG